MYTGITKGVFPVVYLRKQPGLLTYSIELSEKLLAGLEIDASVSIDGVCQTVVNIENARVTFQAMQETLDLTTLNDLQLGDMVSVERSAKIGEENGGHPMYGHIDGMATIIARETRKNNVSLTLLLQESWMLFVYEKGFIGVDGSSLTVSNVDYINHTIQIHLIPHTLQVANFGKKNVGDSVNIELDAQAKAIANVVKNMPILGNIEQRIVSLEERLK